MPVAMSDTARYFSIPWKFGKMFIATTDKGICRLSTNTTRREFEKELKELDGLEPAETKQIPEVGRQLEEYLAGERKIFDVEFDIRTGTGFQKKVWHQLRKIPYGVTISYQELANLVADAGYSRAVGSANGKNPVGIIVPCHRVIRKNGGLGGYAGGIEIEKIRQNVGDNSNLGSRYSNVYKFLCIKKFLLKLEGVEL